MLADLSTKSHPHARLSALRKMWSIEGPTTNTEVSSEEERSPVRIDMIRVKSNPLEPEEFEEKGYKIGRQGNDSIAKVIEDIEAINEKQTLLNQDYDEVQNLNDPTKAFEEILLKQITLE